MDFEFDDNFEETPIEEFDDDSDDLGPILPGSDVAFRLAAAAKESRIKTARYRESQKLLSEIEKRSKECVRLYVPSELQDIYHSARCKEALIAGGNQVGKEQPVSEPILTPHGWVKMGDLNVGDEVIARNGAPCKVTAVYPQGVKPVYRITFNDGSSTRCGIDHLWPTLIGARERYKSRDWKVRSLKDILERCGECPVGPKRPEIPICGAIQFAKRYTTVTPYAMGVLLGDGSFRAGGLQFTSADDQIVNEMRESVPASMTVAAVGSRGITYSVKQTHQSGRPGPRNQILKYLREVGLDGKMSHEKFIPNDYLYTDTESRLALLQGLMDTDGTVDGRGIGCEYSTSSPDLAEGVLFLVRSLGGRARLSIQESGYRGTDGERVSCKPRWRISIHLPNGMNPFRLERKACRYESGASKRLAISRLIESIELVGEEESQCIAVDSEDRTYLTKDCIVTHNSLAGFLEDARAMLGADPYGKYPKENGIMAIVGWDEGHISRVVHRYLFEPGVFQIFKNDNGEWESYKPWLHNGVIDKSRLEDSPPLIPSRFIDKIAWKSRAMNIFSRLELKNGWVIHAFSSRSKPAQGFQLDLAHVDEDIQERGWYREITARTSMRNGLIRWTALPHGKNDVMKGLMDRAEEDEKKYPNNPEKRSAIHVRINVFDNKYMEEETRQSNIRIWRDEGEDIYRQRALGELVSDSAQVYPNFSKYLHDAYSETPHMSKARKMYIENRGAIPQDWMRTMIVDPGHKLLAVVFIATPPPKLGTERFCYGEIAIQRATAQLFGIAVAGFINARRDKPCQKFIIDPHGGSLSGIATGISPRRAYSSELRKHNIYCYDTGSEFVNGSDDIAGRELLLRSWLSINPDTQEPTLFVDTAKCPNVCRNFDRFSKKEVNGIVTDVSDRSGKVAHDHTDCLEYGAAHGLEYIPPPAPKRAKTHAELILEGIRHRKMAAAAQRALSPEALASQMGSISLGPRS